MFLFIDLESLLPELGPAARQIGWDHTGCSACRNRADRCHITDCCWTPLRSGCIDGRASSLFKMMEGIMKEAGFGTVLYRTKPARS